MIEHVLNIRHNAILDVSQPCMQKGFTTGMSYIDAALIPPECLSEARNELKPVSYANIARFVTHPNKSCILIFWEQYPQPQSASFTLNGEEKSQVEHVKHLDIDREVNNKVNVVTR